MLLFREMTTLKLLCFLFALISACSAFGCKKICVLNNRTCVTSGGFNVYKNVVRGVRGLVPPLDPVTIEEVGGEMESVNFKLTNITLIGLKNCTVTLLRLNVTAPSYEQYLSCPRLETRFRYESDEEADSPVLRGQGLARIIAYDYDILNYGLYSVFVRLDHRPHFFIIDHETDTDLKGKLEFELSKACIVNRQSKETEMYMNKNAIETDRCVFSRIIKRAMDILIANIDTYLRQFTMGEVLPFNEGFFIQKLGPVVKVTHTIETE